MSGESGETGLAKRMKIAGLKAAKALGLFALARWATRSQLRILCYHGAWVAPDGFPGDALFMTPELFERRLDRMRALGYEIAPLGAAAAGLARGERAARPRVVITIDDGWRSTYRAMLPALEARGLPATLYSDTAHLLRGGPVPHVMARYFRLIAGEQAVAPEAEARYAVAVDLARSSEERLEAALDFGRAVGLDVDAYLDSQVFAYMTPDEMRDAAARGLDIQLHSHNHTIHDHSGERIAAEIEANRAALATLLGAPPERFTHFCYPSGEASEKAAAALSRLGIESATTLVQELAGPRDDARLLPRILDGQQLSDIEFEAELCGLSAGLRRLKRLLRREPAAAAAPYGEAAASAG